MFEKKPEVKKVDEKKEAELDKKLEELKASTALPPMTVEKQPAAKAVKAAPAEAQPVKVSKKVEELATRELKDWESRVELKWEIRINGKPYGPGVAVVPTESFDVWRHALVKKL